MSSLHTPDKFWAAEDKLSLWSKAAPQAKGLGDLHAPQLSVHLPNSQLANACAVIVNPGGGYRRLASDHEGLQVARWLNCSSSDLT